MRNILFELYHVDLYHETRLRFGRTFGHETFAAFEDALIFLTSDETIFDGSWFWAFGPLAIIAGNCWLGFVLGQSEC